MPTNLVLLEILFESLDEGEAHAITLATELSAKLVLIDERKGWRAAQSLRLQPVGLLGVLIEAKKSNLIPAVQPLLDELILVAGFWIGEALYQKVLASVGE